MAHARNSAVMDDFNGHHSPNRHVSIMTPVSDGSDNYNFDEKGDIMGEQSRSLSELLAARSQGVDPGNTLSRSVANGNDQVQYTLDMMDRFVADTSKQFASSVRRKDSQTRPSTGLSTMLPHSTPKCTSGEYTSQLPRVTGQHHLPSATSIAMLPEALLTNSTSGDEMTKFPLPRAMSQHKLSSATPQ